MIPNQPTSREIERVRALCDPDIAGDYLCAAFAAGPEAYVIAKQEIEHARALVRIATRAKRITYH